MFCFLNELLNSYENAAKLDPGNIYAKDKIIELYKFLNEPYNL